MPPAGDTCWTLIEGAAAGAANARERFCGRYAPLARAYFGTRWRSSLLRQDIDDAVQAVFVECFKPRGALQAVDRIPHGSFHAFFYGVVRNVARMTESAAAAHREVSCDSQSPAHHAVADDTTASRAFDRAWARTIMREAAQHMAARARAAGPEAERRYLLLNLRFQESQPIREIARAWDVDAERLHREYARARREFKVALREVLDDHNPGAPRAVEEEWARLAEFLGSA